MQPLEQQYHLWLDNEKINSKIMSYTEEIYNLVPEESKEEISIEKILEITSKIQEDAFYGGYSMAMALSVACSAEIAYL